jgi:hypothetical protein
LIKTSLTIISHEVARVVTGTPERRSGALLALELHERTLSRCFAHLSSLDWRHFFVFVYCAILIISGVAVVILTYERSDRSLNFKRFTGGREEGG